MLIVTNPHRCDVCSLASSIRRCRSILEGHFTSNSKLCLVFQSMYSLILKPFCCLPNKLCLKKCTIRKILLLQVCNSMYFRERGRNLMFKVCLANLARPYPKLKVNKRVEKLVPECLPTMHRTMGSIPSVINEHSHPLFICLSQSLLIPYLSC